VNEIKVFITVEMESKDVPDEHKEQTCVPLVEVFDATFELIKKDIPTQLKITNLPPRRKGFVSASELMDIEK